MRLSSTLTRDCLSRISRFTFAAILMAPLLLGRVAEATPFTTSNAQHPRPEPGAAHMLLVGRPLLLRSDALSGPNYAKLKEFAQRGIDPRTGIRYDWRGFPKLKSAFDVQLKPPQFRSEEYGKICNKQLLAEIKRDLRLRRQFTSEDIARLEQGKNPQGKHWHHDPRKKGRMQLVDKADHSVDHVGGDKVWGRIDEKAFAKGTALRWGSVAVFDYAISSVALIADGEFNLDHLAHVTTRSVASGAAGFGTEYLMVKLMPQFVGMPPGWYGGVRILFGGPAACGATLSYAVTRALIDYCWENYRLHQIQIQEEACRVAETKARWHQLVTKTQGNTEIIGALLTEFSDERRTSYQ
jgi:hypothetical protein